MRFRVGSLYTLYFIDIKSKHSFNISNVFDLILLEVVNGTVNYNVSVPTCNIWIYITNDRSVDLPTRQPLSEWFLRVIPELKTTSIWVPYYACGVSVPEVDTTECDLYLKFVTFIPGANFSIISLIYKISGEMELTDKAESQKVLHYKGASQQWIEPFPKVRLVLGHADSSYFYHFLGPCPCLS